MSQHYVPPDVGEMKNKIYTMIADERVRIKRHEIIKGFIPKFIGKTVMRKKHELEAKLNLHHPEAPLESGSEYCSKNWSVRQDYNHWVVMPGSHRIAKQEDDASYVRFDLGEFRNLDYHSGPGAEERIAKLNKFIDSGGCELVSDLCRKFAHMAVAWKLLLDETGLEYTFKDHLKQALSQGSLYIH